MADLTIVHLHAMVETIDEDLVFITQLDEVPEIRVLTFEIVVVISHVLVINVMLNLA